MRSLLSLLIWGAQSVRDPAADRVINMSATFSSCSAKTPQTLECITIHILGPRLFCKTQLQVCVFCCLLLCRCVCVRVCAPPGPEEEGGRWEEWEEEEGGEVEVTEVWLMDDKTILGFVERNGLLWNKRISSLSFSLRSSSHSRCRD